MAVAPFKICMEPAFHIALDSRTCTNSLQKMVILLWMSIGKVKRDVHFVQNSSESLQNIGQHHPVMLNS